MPKVSMPDNKSTKQEPVKQIDTTKRIDEQLLKPGKYEVTDNDTFTIDIHLSKRENRWIIVDKSQDKTKEIEAHSIIFRMWTFEEDVLVRKQATSYDVNKRLHFLDNDLLNRLKVQKLLKSWTFEKDNPRLKLLHIGGVLSDEGYAAFSKLQPNIIRYILDKMNNVLEFNG